MEEEDIIRGVIDIFSSSNIIFVDEGKKWKVGVYRGENIFFVRFVYFFFFFM